MSWFSKDCTLFTIPYVFKLNFIKFIWQSANVTHWPFVKTNKNNYKRASSLGNIYILMTKNKSQIHLISQEHLITEYQIAETFLSFFHFSSLQVNSTVVSLNTRLHFNKLIWDLFMVCSYFLLNKGYIGK